MDSKDRLFMQRCFELAQLGVGNTSPNPIVGALVVHDGRIIGEGYHRAYRQAHAEVNAIQSISPEDRRLLPYSTLYVSLEPCNIFRNTPPCTDLIIRSGIPRVVISSLDRTPGVNGLGVERLRQAGIIVEVGVLEEQGLQLSRPRNIFVTENRPYVILKFAQSQNGMFAPREHRQLWLTNPFSKRLVHRWRSEVDAILVGGQTARVDNPRLTNRLYFGGSPRRVVLSRSGKLPGELALFDGETSTIIISEEVPPELPGNGLFFLRLSFGEGLISELLSALARQSISLLLVEGGIQTLRAFLDAGLWDEARVFVSPHFIPEGRPAPQLPLAPVSRHSIAADTLLLYRNLNR